MNIVLASASPRRRELLTMLGLDFKIIPAKGEEHIEANMSPKEAVLSLSRGKAMEVAALCGENDVIIAADTVVALGGEILGKPKSTNEAVLMLSKLSGREHTVFTGVTVMRGGITLTEHEKTDVRFCEMTQHEIEAYVATGEPMDKAGAYGAQGIGALFVEHIDGDFFNVMGLPIFRLSQMLKKLGVNLI